jgi:hypothetical protein
MYVRDLGYRIRGINGDNMDEIRSKSVSKYSSRARREEQTK